MSSRSARPESPNGASPSGPIESELSESFELAMVLSHYEVGVIKGIARFGRGSSGTPKLLIQSSAGKFVLKRRGFAHGGDETVRFGHRLQHALVSSGYPLPRLIGSKDDGKSVARVRGRAFELFRYVDAERYRGTEAQTRQAGYALSLFHAIARGIDSAGAPRATSYHNNAQTPDRLLVIADRVGSLNRVCRGLAETYEHAAARATALGLDGWPAGVTHGDWHAGNLLYDGDRLIGVIDYDTARTGQRVLDIASGALQFSLIGAAPSPSDWPAELDEGRLSAFIGGYEALEEERAGAVISKAELEAMPHLMVESLISEAVGPIATTGKFGIHEPGPVLEMIERKAKWILENVERVKAAAG